jgi:hypothetical protein
MCYIGTVISANTHSLAHSVRLTVHILYINNNPHYALFIFSLLSYHTATCFGRISSPSSGSIMYICGKWYS